MSVRVDENVKRRLEEAGVDVHREVRKHLEDLAWRVELKERLKRLDGALKDMPPAPPGLGRTEREGRP